MRVATRRRRGPAAAGSISIHATHAGGDFFCGNHNYNRYISIHATHAGGDIWYAVLYDTFQSTPPMRVATPMNQNYNFPQGFQSTPPMRVATIHWFTLPVFS